MKKVLKNDKKSKEMDIRRKEKGKTEKKKCPDLRPHRFGEIPEGSGARQVQFLSRIVSQDPGENWVLHQVIVRPPGQRVQVH